MYENQNKRAGHPNKMNELGFMIRDKKAGIHVLYIIRIMAMLMVVYQTIILCYPYFIGTNN
jgi:hypothetical protein